MKAQLTLAVLLLVLASRSSVGEESVQYLLFDQDRQLELQVSSRFDEAMNNTIREWIENLADALTLVYGHWPRQFWQVEIKPASTTGDDPIPWAQVRRGDPDRVEFFILPRAEVTELKRAWTGYHEVAHLLIPYRGWGGAWFSEGLASYYQNILQARAGILSEQQMWQKLYEGYQRARADSRFDGQDLQSVSDRLRSNGAFMRVYWSGAWYFLAADARLRLASGGKRSLDQALAKLNRCCADQSMSVPAMVRKLDEVNEMQLFQPLYEQAIAATTTPGYETIFQSLDISIDNGRVRLNSGSAAAQLRRQIVSNEGL